MLEIGITQVCVLSQGIQIGIDLIGIQVKWGFAQMQADLGNPPGIAEYSTFRIAFKCNLLFKLPDMVGKTRYLTPCSFS